MLNVVAGKDEGAAAFCWQRRKQRWRSDTCEAAAWAAHEIVTVVVRQVLVRLQQCEG